jgi:iron complex transport system permease protein
MKEIKDLKQPIQGTKNSKEINSDKNYKLIIFWMIVLFGSILLVLIMLFSITKGATNIPVDIIFDALFSFDSDNSIHLTIVDLRLPRVIASALVGSAFAVSGAIMQGMTKNPLAEPGIMGINAGAVFALSICFAFYPGVGYLEIIMLSFLGAAFGSLLVNGVVYMRRGGATPARLVLAGVAINALLTSLSQGVGLTFDVAQNMMFWTVGGVAGSNWGQIKIMAPCIVAALLGAVILSPRISMLSLGEDVAKGLGLNVVLTNVICSIIVLILAGASVSVVGAVGFVGLIIPHISRFLVGIDYRRIIPASAVLGSILMVLADLCARMINPPFETPVGALISLIGVPFFLYLANRQRSMN